jgi:hypothetical protein
LEKGGPSGHDAYINFGGGWFTIANAGSLAFSSGLYMIVAHAPIYGNYNLTIACKGNTPGSPDWMWQFESGYPAWYSRGAGYYFNSGAVNTAGFGLGGMVHEFWWDGTYVRQWVNGSRIDRQSVGSIGGSTDSLRIGNQGNSGTNSDLGNISEIAFFSAPSYDTIKSARAYMLSKYKGV